MSVHEQSKFYGLVLAGGHSRRMGKDKSLLTFHGKSQVEFAVGLLSGFCEKVFVSCRQDQSASFGGKNFSQIYDKEQYKNIGPLGGILSAMEEYPQQTWIVLACDLPFVTRQTIQQLIDGRNTQKVATAYISVYDQLPEPLCAIYETRIYRLMKEFLQMDINCPRKILISSNTELLKQKNNNQALDNVNNPEEYQRAKKILKT